jgi:hypothetical protein
LGLVIEETRERWKEELPIEESFVLFQTWQLSPSLHDCIEEWLPSFDLRPHDEHVLLGELMDWDA